VPSIFQHSESLVDIRKKTTQRESINPGNAFSSTTRKELGSNGLVDSDVNDKNKWWFVGVAWTWRENYPRGEEEDEPGPGGWAGSVGSPYVQPAVLS
jgi:hypothetical protein